MPIFSKENLKRNWGFFFLLFEVAIMIVVTVARPLNFHYSLFTGPSPWLWSGLNPYEKGFGCDNCFFLYSPSSGLFFFALFAWLPRRLGLTLYLLVSLAVLGWGIRALSRELERQKLFSLENSAYRNLIWLMIGGPIMDAVLWAKVEMVQLGIVMLCVTCLIGRRRAFLAALVLGFVTSWKFQPVPVVGLVSLVLLYWSRDLKLAATIGLGVVAGLFLPWLVLPTNVFFEANRLWLHSVAASVRDRWEGNQQIYQFLTGSLGIPITLQTANAIAASAGVAAAAYLLFWMWKMRGRKTEARRAEAFLYALAIGSAHAVLFSPYSQGNGYVLYLPLLFLFLTFEKQLGVRKQVTWGFLITCFYMISLSGFDITPRSIRLHLAGMGIKPLGIALLIGFTLYLAEVVRRASSSRVARHAVPA